MEYEFFKKKAIMKSVKTNIDVNIQRHKIVFSQNQNYPRKQPMVDTSWRIVFLPTKIPIYTLVQHI